MCVCMFVWMLTLTRKGTLPIVRASKPLSPESLNFSLYWELTLSLYIFVYLNKWYCVEGGRFFHPTTRQGRGWRWETHSQSLFATLLAVFVCAFCFKKGACLALCGWPRFLGVSRTRKKSKLVKREHERERHRFFFFFWLLSVRGLLLTSHVHTGTHLQKRTHRHTNQARTCEYRWCGVTGASLL